MKPATPEAIELMHRGTVALAQVEANGIHIDEKYLAKAIIKTKRRIDDLQEELKQDDIYKKWKKRYGAATKLGAPEQLATIIFQVLGYESRKGRTRSGKWKANEEAFEHVKLPFLDKMREMKRLQKAYSTNLMGLQREVMNGKIHPSFNLNTVITFRSSAQNPNIQNQPVRNEDIGTLIRSCFIAPPGYQIGELDYKQIEVAISATYHKDPVMIDYINDSSKDMHRDMAMQIFKLQQEEVTKQTRYAAKNGYVFAEFYGSFYVDCARNLWEMIERFNLKTAEGVPLKKHLRRQGIRECGDCLKPKDGPLPDPKRGSFEEHLRSVEKDFWNNRFRTYAQWKRDWWAKYTERGYFRMKTGFVCSGLLNRKQVCNSPIQGAAFHCLLWSLIELQDWLLANKMKTKIIGEIHDSCIVQFYVKERDAVLAKAKEIMTQNIRKAWRWINVPLSVEAEIAPEGQPWSQKKPVPM